MTIALADEQHALLQEIAKTRKLTMADVLRKLLVEAGAKPVDRWPSRYRPRAPKAASHD